MHERPLRAIAGGLAIVWTTTLPAAEVVDGPLGRKLDRHMSAQAEKGFCGVLLVERRGKIVLSKGYGYAWIKNKVPFTSETVFDIGSITKQFTAAAIMRLEVDGKLSTDDTLTKFFDNVPPDKQDLTLHHLLTHTSGLEGEVEGDYKVFSRDETLRDVFAMKVVAPPGERFSYSNGGYSVLGAVVEIASGKPYESYLHETFWQPAGMHHTGYRLPDWSKVVMARGVLNYGIDWGSPIDKPWAEDGPSWNLRANGGVLSTAEDMYRWHRALLGDAILSEAAKAKMFTPYAMVSQQRKLKYGYGWFLTNTDRGTRLIRHDGSNTIFFAALRRFVDEDTVIILASSDSRHPGDEHLAELTGMVFED